MLGRYVLTIASLPVLCAGCAVASSRQQTIEAVPEPVVDSISFETRAGTSLAFDISRDGRSIVLDLLGQLWLLPGEGGAAFPITDAVRDTAEDLDPVFSPDGQWVLFQGDRAGVKGLWLVRRDGTGLKRLTDPAASAAIMPAWAPDGRSLAFALRDSIRIMDVGSRVVRTLRIEGLPSPAARYPAWSADGAYIAFAHPGGRIWEVASEGGTASALTPASLNARGPAYSPDNSRIAFFARDSAGIMQVWVQERTGGAPQRLADHLDTTPLRVRWSQGGDTILYAADGLLWRRPLSGGQPEPIPFTARVSFSRARAALNPIRFPEPGEQRPARGHMGLALSPDAQRIAVIALGRLWIIPIGGTPREVAVLPRTAAGLAWSPDGRYVAWSAGLGGSENLFITNVETGATRQFTSLPGREDRPSWSPDGDWIAFIHWPKPACDTPPSQSDDECGRLRVRVARATPTMIERVEDARALDANLGIGWTFSFFGQGQETPQWSPASDGVFFFDSGRATFALLEGGTRDLGPFPEGATFVHWRADSSLVYVRDNALWQSRFPTPSATPATPMMLTEDPALYPSVARDGTILYLSTDGLRLLHPDDRLQRLGWPLSYRVSPAPETLLIRGGRVIDGTGAAPAARDLLLVGGRIARVAEPGSIQVAPETRIVEAEGRTVIPGLIDLHGHLWDDAVLPGALYHGVTTLREMGGSAARAAGLRDAIGAGLVAGPRVVLGGFQFYPGGNGTSGVVIQSPSHPAAAARGIALLRALGGDYVKMRFPGDQSAGVWMIREAHAAGMRISGHCAHTLPLVAAGIEGKEHLSSSCAPRSDGIWYDDLIQLFRAGGMWVVPTTASFASVPRLLADTAVLDAPGVASFMTPFLRWWGLRLPPDRGPGYARLAQTSLAAATALQGREIIMAPASDNVVFPNALHAELEEFVAAGFSPLEAITAATGTAARILGADGELGTIAVGRLADLVILEADPLADVGNTQHIWRVIQGGRIVDRDALLRWEHR